MQGLLELVLEVADLDRSVAFYRDVLGLREVERWQPQRLGVWLDLGRNAVLGLWPKASGGEGVAIAGSRGGSHVHFAMYVRPGQLTDLQQRIQDAGLKVRDSVEFTPGNRSLFVSDPDANVVELADWTRDWAGQVVTRSESLG